MAGLIAVGQTSEIALSSATTRTVIQLLAPTNQRAKLQSWGVFFDGTSPTAEPVQVELLRQTTAGTMSTGTAVKWDGLGAEAVQTTFRHTATVEPTAGDIIDCKEVHPQAGYEVQYALGQEVVIPGAGRLGIRCTAPAGVNVRAFVRWEE